KITNCKPPLASMRGTAVERISHTMVPITVSPLASASFTTLDIKASLATSKPSRRGRDRPAFEDPAYPSRFDVNSDVPAFECFGRGPRRFAPASRLKERDDVPSQEVQDGEHDDDDRAPFDGRIPHNLCLLL